MPFPSSDDFWGQLVSLFLAARTSPKRWRALYSDDREVRIAVRLTDALFIILVLALSSYGIFWLPYAFPPATPSPDSVSYLVGYDNHVAMVVFLGTIALLVLRCFAWQWLAPEKVGAMLCGPPGRRRVRMPKSVLLLMLVIYASVCIAIVHFASSHFAPSFEDYGQSSYSVLRLNLALQYHLRPFLDIQWPYGALLFYVPLMAMRIVSAMGGTTQIGFGIGYIILQCAAGLMLFYFIDQLCIKVSYRVLLFCIFSLIWFDVSLPVQVPLLRFLGPFFALLVLHRTCLKLGPARSPRSVLFLAGVCIACNLAVLSIGVEVGIPHAIAQIVYCVYAAVRGDRSRLYGALATLLSVPLFLVLFPGSTQMLMTSSGGFSYTPLYPSIFAIAYLASAFWAVPLLIGSSLAADPGPNAAFALGVAALMIFQMPYALGRADCGHLHAGGMTAYLLALAMIAKFRPRVFPVAMTLIVLIFGLAFPIASPNASNSFNQLLPGLLGNSPPPVVPQSPLVAALDLEKYPSIATPFGADPNTRAFLSQTGRFFVEYNPDFITVGTESDIQQKIDGLKNASVILVPQGVPDTAKVSDFERFQDWQNHKDQIDQNWSTFQTQLCLLPVHIKTKRMPFNPMFETARRIASLYTPIGSADGWVLMKRK